MTTTDTDPVAALTARMDALIASLGRVGLVLPPEAAPLAAGDLPPHVAAGELITSAWGNAVVDELVRQRTEAWNNFVHNGGTGTGLGWYDNGTTVLGPYTYPVRVHVIASLSGGYNTVATAWSGEIVRLSDGVGIRSSGAIRVDGGYWGYITLNAAYDIAPGAAAGFKTRTNYSGMETTGGTFYYGCSGTYHVQRTDT